MAAVASVVRPRLAVRAAPFLAIAYGVCLLLATRSVTGAFGYAGTPHAFDLVAGLALLGAGVIVCIDGNSPLLGVLAILSGAAWFAPHWEAFNAGSTLIRSAGTAFTPLFLVLLLHLVLVVCGRITRAARAGLVAAYALTAGVIVIRALFRDPFLDPYCLRNCLVNVFLVHADSGLALAADDLWRRAALVLAFAVFAAASWRLWRASEPARRILAPVLLPASLAGTAEAAYAVALLRTPLEAPHRADFVAILYARSLAVTVLAVGLVWTVVRRRRVRAAVSRLAVAIRAAPPAGHLREALASAVGDSTLDVAYWLPRTNEYVDAEGGQVAAPMRGQGRAVTPIIEHGRELALVAHDAALLNASDFERQLGSAARLAIENERLRAEVLAQLEDIRSSRARIVERGDTERRRLERDLHDGAQQRLLALLYDLRLARASAETVGEAETSALLTSALSEAEASLSDLRELAHGIYPAILGEAGLASALATLADEAPLPVELHGLPERRYGSAVETAAYLTVAEAIQDASRRSATFVSVDLAHADGILTVETRDDAAARSSPPIHLSDRIGALGGTIRIAAGKLRAEIPCA